MERHVVYIGLGSNRNDRRGNIEAALRRLSGHPDVDLLDVSTLVKTEPKGVDHERRFLNGAAGLETTLSPFELLEVLERIETLLGRERKAENRPRTIDLDLLFYDDRRIDTDRLTVPHPRAHERRFVLEPLAEIAPDFVHPVRQTSIKDLLNSLTP